MPDPPAFAARDDRAAIENGLAFAPKFDDRGLIPAIAADHATGEVLMVAWMNEEALRRTLEIGEAVFFSRSRREIWHKGATSGHTLVVKEMRTDCDQDAILLRVEQKGPGCCHNGYRSCFYRRIPLGANDSPYPLVQAEKKVYDPKAVYGKGG